MEMLCKKDPQACGKAAAAEGLKALRAALAQKREVNIILATGLSQFELLAAMVKADDIDWHRVNAFHLDEYVGMPIRHKASFRKILWQEFFAKLPIPLKSFHWIDGESDPQAECRRLGDAIAKLPIDVAFIGIGENGHVAFNDPPADFATEQAFIQVKLDEACRKQQFGEGWFPTLADVPTTAISMSIRQIMKSKTLIVTVPDERKAAAVKNALEGPISNLCPASILRCHPDARVFFDAGAVSKLSAGMAPDTTRTMPVEPMPK